MWTSYGETDVKISFRVKFCSRWTYPEVCMTEYDIFSAENHWKVDGEIYLRGNLLRCHILREFALCYERHPESMRG